MANWRQPPLPVGDPRRPIPKDRGPRTPRRMKGKWDEGSVEHDLPIIEKTKMVLDTAEDVAQADEGVSIKRSLRQKLELLGWGYNRGATFRANFPFRSKHLIFNSVFIKEGAQHIHRVKVVMGHDGVSGYKLMKWVPKVMLSR